MVLNYSNLGLFPLHFDLEVSDGVQTFNCDSLSRDSSTLQICIQLGGNRWAALERRNVQLMGFTSSLVNLTRVCLEFNLRLKDFICLAYKEVVQESIILFVVQLM